MPAIPHCQLMLGLAALVFTISFLVCGHRVSKLDIALFITQNRFLFTMLIYEFNSFVPNILMQKYLI